MYGMPFSVRLTILDFQTHIGSEAKIQEKLIIYFKAKIDVGVSNGLTSLPPLLPRYVHRFPEEMLQELRSYAKSVLETDPNNGAAAKFLAIEAFREVDTQKPIKKYPLLEKAMVLVPNDVEICFFAFAMCTRLGNQMTKRHLFHLKNSLSGSVRPVIRFRIDGCRIFIALTGIRLRQVRFMNGLTPTIHSLDAGKPC